MLDILLKIKKIYKIKVANKWSSWWKIKILIFKVKFLIILNMEFMLKKLNFKYKPKTLKLKNYKSQKEIKFN